MKFAVIATLALTTVSAGSMLEGATCAKYDDCVDTNLCATLVNKSTNTAGTLKNICVLKAKCDAATDVTSTDGADDAAKAYTTVMNKCLKKEAAAGAAKLGAGAKCKLSTECMDKMKCGGSGEVADYVCTDETTCGKDVADKKVNCESAIRSAVSMAAAALVAAYAL
jgi:hypothetical protein